MEPTAITHEKKGKWSEPNLHDYVQNVNLQGVAGARRCMSSHHLDGCKTKRLLILLFLLGDHFCLNLPFWNEGPSTFKFQKIKETAYHSGEESPRFCLKHLSWISKGLRNGLFDLWMYVSVFSYIYIHTYKECDYPYNSSPLWKYRFNHPSNSHNLISQAFFFMAGKQQLQTFRTSQTTNPPSFEPTWTKVPRI